MKVKEVIETLSKLDPEARFYKEYDGGFYDVYPHYFKEVKKESLSKYYRDELHDGENKAVILVPYSVTDRDC